MRAASPELYSYPTHSESACTSYHHKLTRTLPLANRLSRYAPWLLDNLHASPNVQRCKHCVSIFYLACGSTRLALIKGHYLLHRFGAANSQECHSADCHLVDPFHRHGNPPSHPNRCLLCRGCLKFLPRAVQLRP